MIIFRYHSTTTSISELLVSILQNTALFNDTNPNRVLLRDQTIAALGQILKAQVVTSFCISSYYTYRMDDYMIVFG